MSVYTKVEHDQLKEFLKYYDLGCLLEQQGISDGIENTNYFVTTSTGKYVLTLFESLSSEELPFFLDLMAFLADHNVSSAHPLADRNGSYLRTLNNRPAALVDRLPGAWVASPSAAQCAALGKMLGRLHREGQKFKPQRTNTRGPKWWWQTTERLINQLSETDARMLRNELAFQSSHRNNDLPRGIIHADLFRDNALFQGNELTGVIDFYYACTDVLLYDLAVTVNDWCSNKNGILDKTLSQSLLQAYNAERPLLDQEQKDWSVMLRAGALRFWLSRLQDKLFPRPGEMTHIKDPEEYARVLRNRIACSKENNLPWL